ncbi:MAG: hypothetical protein JNL74_17595 [Fibrobacteres bacterium]|nr:hypothetical protein [Fibrobacterota bacterium]
MTDYKLYKTVFRLDFAPCFALGHKLGEQLDFLSEKTSCPPYTQQKRFPDFLNNQIQLFASTELNNELKDQFNISFNIQNINGEQHYRGGRSVSSAVSSELFSLTDSLLDNLHEKCPTFFTRIGIRFFVLLSGDPYSFAKLHNLFRDSNKFIDKATSSTFDVPMDVALTWEAKNKKEDHVRLVCGPYSKSEYRKFFLIEPPIEDGLLLDVDIWQSNISLPGFKITEQCRRFQKLAHDVCTNLDLSTKKELSI